ncbi:alcohol dehydrogenase GroES-like domain-containing protein [Phlyctema vagabunda]|uniref:Alcohol dehydrogenase GroES-like domain-containing protein n=1 Tax=Phlyctema vagabunda TaxID=108571 RepID=A0ABR4P3K3_9HELO
MPSLPKTYKAAIFEQPNSSLKVIDVELKHPGPGQVLVKVLTCGVCHSDAMVQNGALGSQFPRVPGHEIIGDIVELGEGVSNWVIGDRVGGGWHGGHDGTCKQCRRGLYQMCSNGTVNGVYIDGGYAEYVLLRTEAVVRVPKDADPAEYAPLLCAGLTVFNSMRRLNIGAGELVAIQGLGGLGHLAVQYANKMGFKVVALSNGSSKAEFAKKLGAHEYIDTSKEDGPAKLAALGGAAMIVSTAPNPAVIPPLLNGLQAGGHLLLLAPVGPVEIDTVTLLQKAASVSSFPCGHAWDAEDTIEFTKLHEIKCLIEKFPLADAQKAFEHTLGGHVRFRSVLVME